MTFFEFILFALSIITAENIFFARAVDMGKIYDFIDKPRNITHLGFSLTCMNVCAAVLSYPVAVFFPRSGAAALFRPAVFLIVAYVGYVLLFMSRMKFTTNFPPAVCMNGVVLSTLLICSRESYSLVQTILYAAAAAIGYMIAMLIVHLGRVRLSYSTPPKAFRGFPVLLVYIGLISLALYGLLGHQLPV